MASFASHFARGTGVYECRCCERHTRATGRGDNEHASLCAECYDLGGFMNAITDGETMSDADLLTMVATYNRLLDLAGRVHGGRERVERCWLPMFRRLGLEEVA